MVATILTQLDRAGPYRVTAKRLEALAEEWLAQGFSHSVFMPAQPSSATDWLQQLGANLALPAHFGANFDALYDCLCDPEVLKLDKLVLELPDTQALGEAGCDTLIAVLQAVADEWRARGHFFWVLFSEPGIELDALPIAKT